ncbi:hypothetical protein FPV67DRAFT_721875 [Lyophyllum atratum]|nr:hypothetical protein FPV67DRAFT_721875 [Lyophyllum atratum]
MAMDDSQNNKTRGPPHSSSTCELPTPPPLFNCDRRLGPRRGLRALAFPFATAEQDRWADLHGFVLRVGEAAPGNNRRLRTVMHILRRLPTCRLGSIPTDGNRRISSSAIFVTTNATPEELQRGMDLQLIRRVQEVLATDELPFWVKPCRDWCIVLSSLRAWTSVRTHRFSDNLELPHRYKLFPSVVI